MSAAAALSDAPTSPLFAVPDAGGIVRRAFIANVGGPAMGPAAVALLAVVRTCSAERDAFAEDAEATDAALRVVAAGGAGAVDAADAIRIARARARRPRDVSSAYAPTQT